MFKNKNLKFKKKNLKYFNYISAVIAAGTGFLHGYDISLLKTVFLMDAFKINFGLATWDGNYRDNNGTLLSVFNNGAEPRYRYLVDTDDNDFIEGVITMSYVFGTIFGALIISYLGDRLGRKKSIIISSIIFTIGSLANASAMRSYIIIALGRFIVGLAIGSFSVICPVYISEIAPSKSRGELSFFYYIFMITGIFISSIVNVHILYYMNINNKKELNVTREDPSKAINNTDWRLAFFIQSFLCGIYTALVFILPKSPSWLCYNERNVEALHTLAKIHNTNLNDYSLQDEFNNLQNDAIINRAIGYSNYSELFIPSIRRRTFVIIFMNFIQQWTGIALYLCFETHIFKGLGGSEFENEVIIPILMIFIPCMLSAFVCFSLIDRYGRKSLLLVGTLFMLVINLYNIFSFPYNSQNRKISNFTPLFANLDNCNSGLGSSSPFHHDNDLDIDLYNNQCHKYVYYCPYSVDKISWDKDISQFKNASSKADEFCKIVSDLETTALTKEFSKSSMVIFLSIYISAWLAVPFIYKAEIFPLRIRTKGSAMGTLSAKINSLLTFVIIPYLYQMWGSRLCILFTLVCFVGSIFTIVCVTECKGVSLDKMEEKMSGKVIEF